MAKIPRDPKEIFSEFSATYRGLFGNDIVSIILFGSGAKGEYVSKRSDINFLIVLTEQGISELTEAMGLIDKWHQRNVSTPLFLTEKYINSSLDVFPIEFLEMQAHHVVVYGKDVLENLKFEILNVRLQVERELKGKLIQLRQSFLGTNGKIKFVENLVERSLPTFTAIFDAIYYLKHSEMPKNRQMLAESLSVDFNFDVHIFDNLWKIKIGNHKFSKEEIIDLAKKYIGEIEKISEVIDKWKP